MANVTEVRDNILALSPDERYRLASYLFAHNESKLAHLVVRSAVVDEAASFEVDDGPLLLPGVAA